MIRGMIVSGIILIFGSVLVSAAETDFSMNGAVLKEKRNESEIWVKPDGTVINVYKDRSEAVLPDKTRIVKFPDGKRDVRTSNGQVIKIDEARGIREYTGKKEKTVNFQGMTPFGEKIVRVEKLLSRDPMVRMIYIPDKSDEQLYIEKGSEKFIWEIRDFFDELYPRLRQKFINAVGAGSPYKGKPFDIVVSYCRYCKTGYCFGKEASVTVEIMENGTVKKVFTLEDSLLRDKKRMVEFAAAVSDSISIP